MADLVNEQNLLDEYKKYDFLNKEKAKIKILVSYIKPSFLFKSEILTPIHLGRAVEKEISKDGIQSDEDINWLHQNCIGDDTNENISKVNRKVGFLTGTYWAWKNYEKLGNPEYFGSFGTRKLFVSKCLNNIVNYDIIIPTKETLKYQNNKEQFIEYHSSNLYKAIITNLKRVHPGDMNLFDEYLDKSYGYYHELYIMKKHIFFDFCSWIYPILIQLLNDQDCKVIFDSDDVFSKCFQFHGVNEKRDIAYVTEILTGYFLFKLTCDKKIKYQECDYVVFEQMNNKKDVKKLMSLLRKNIELKSRSNQ